MKNSASKTCMQLQYLINKSYKWIQEACNLTESEACSFFKADLEKTRLEFQERNCPNYNNLTFKSSAFEEDEEEDEMDVQVYDPCTLANSLLFHTISGLNTCITGGCNERQIKLFEEDYQVGNKLFKDNKCWQKNNNF